MKKMTHIRNSTLTLEILMHAINEKNDFGSTDKKVSGYILLILVCSFIAKKNKQLKQVIWFVYLLVQAISIFYDHFIFSFYLCNANFFPQTRKAQWWESLRWQMDWLVESKWRVFCVRTKSVQGGIIVWYHESGREWYFA